jgi:PII-like signaling protein
MLNLGKAVKVTIYISEGSTHKGAAAYSSILDFLFFRGVTGATVMKAVAGFGADHHLHSASMVDISDKLPMKIEFIETQEKVDELLGQLQEMAGTGMIELQETTVAKSPQLSKAQKAAAPHVKIEGISGYGAHRRVHKEKPFHLSRDNSIMLTVVDTEEKLKAFLPIVDQMVQEGLVVLSDVDIIKYSHRAEAEGAHD